MTPATARLALLEGWLRQDAGNAALRLSAFEAARGAGRLDAAALHAEAGVADGAEAGAWLHRLAQVRLAQRDVPSARALLARARAAGAPAAVVNHDLAWIAHQAGQTDHCLDLLRPHLAGADDPPLEPTVLASLQVLWLRTLQQAGRHQAALEWTVGEEAAGRLQPAGQGVASVLAWDAGELDLAERLAQAALATDAAHADALLTLASLALLRRQDAPAEAFIDRALAARPAEGRTWSLAGMASLQRGDTGQARLRFQRAIGGMPGHIGTWHGLGWACLLAGDREAALRAFERALFLDPAFGESHGAVGLAQALGGDAEAAEASLRTALKLDPACVTARYARAVMAGEASADGVPALAGRLLDRPGFFRRSLAAEVQDRVAAPPVRPSGP
ncbi:tetratricopeptide repeat protein [Ramlibacter pinisoli]|uniref:Tetratricopeptide repeat protein n=2 Tax=Ramlibacter TaxID=174951 RepID=A0A6N8IUQ5_9BURK|nr:tetratricopeptide repeat protein [Ramlibacter pinisoli]MVQ29736.1 tetratricopeptide repeat protein [Ramlibacter pinisoli]